MWNWSLQYLTSELFMGCQQLTAKIPHLPLLLATSPDDIGRQREIVGVVQVVLEGPVSRPVQDWKKTGLRPVLVFQILKQKTTKRPVQTGLL